MSDVGCDGTPRLDSNPSRTESPLLRHRSRTPEVGQWVSHSPQTQGASTDPSGCQSRFHVTGPTKVSPTRRRVGDGGSVYAKGPPWDGSGRTSTRQTPGRPRREVTCVPDTVEEREHSHQEGLETPKVQNFRRNNFILNMSHFRGSK